MFVRGYRLLQAEYLDCASNSVAKMLVPASQGARFQFLTEIDCPTVLASPEFLSLTYWSILNLKPKMLIASSTEFRIDYDSSTRA